MSEEAFDYDGTGVSTGDDFTIPDDVYVLQIVKVKRSRSKLKDDGTGGHPQVIVNFKVAEGERVNFPVNFHYVTFCPKDQKGAGIAIKFLKSIGEPWEGKFNVNPENWIGKKCRGFLEAESYQGKRNMKVRWVESLDAEREGLSGSPDLTHAMKKDEESVPF